MNAKEATREVVQQVCAKLYQRDNELQVAYEEVRQRQQDFELAEDAFVESAELYLRAAEARLDVILRAAKIVAERKRCDDIVKTLAAT